ncbi:hypothetical protein AX16_006429 [Volvariella volvacea WC 439]|nr:hypothetical protein AX16_006429 [Volvariella volvacea WC 439]
MSSHPPSSSQPIAFPSSSHNPDHTMSTGSYTGSNGDFNPASFTRHFLGSPISWRAGSFGARIPSGSPTAYLLNSLDPNTVKMSSSIESDRGSLMNALNVFDREGELCRNYTCCGLHLNDLHALLEHFEEVHLSAVDPNAPNTQPQIQVPFNPQSHPPLQNPQHQGHQQPSYYPAQMTQQPYSAPIDPDEMELELDLDNSTQPLQHFQQPQHHLQPPPSSAHSSPSSGAPTPPDTPISTPLSSYPSPTSFYPNQPNTHQAHSPYASQPPSPHASTFDPNRRSSNSPPSAPAGTRPSLNLNLTTTAPFSSRGMISQPFTNPEDAFNPYARFSSDYSSCLPGAQYNAASVDEANMLSGAGAATSGGGALQSPHLAHLQHGFGQQGHQQGGCVTPALLFSGTTTPASTPATSRVPSPTSGYGPSLGVHPHALSQGNTPISSVPSTPISPTSRSPTTSKPNTLTRHSSTSSLTSRPTSSLLLSKPFKCPKPNCNKSYKQANGLKYHITHGSCNFAPPKDLEHVKDLLERKRRDRERQAAESGNPGLTRSASQDGSTGVGASSLLIASEYPDLSSISESELREVEREAEKRLRPFACGVGDCQRRYKNMNGLRYHYQHSGEHGAIGLALLASGQHECLSGSRRQHDSHGHSVDGEKRGSLSGQGESREGRRRVMGIRGGSASVPVSRATSTSRTGTPVPVSAVQMGYFGQTTQALPFTPPPTHSLTQQLTLQTQQQSVSHPASPTVPQQTMSYQQQFATMQRQQYAQMQYAALYQQSQQQSSQQPQGLGTGLDVNMS